MAEWKRLVVVGVGSLLLPGCARSETCERGRMALDKMWETVQTQAAQLKLSTAETAGSQVRVWSGIEGDVDLLQSSFATEQITWESAKRKVGELQQSIQELGVPPTSSFQSFRDTISRAASMQGDLEKSCR